MAQLSPKSPPYSLEAEQAVLGGLMLDNQTWDQVTQVLQSEDFYQPAHQFIFETLTTLSQKMQPFDVVTIVEQLKTAQQLDKVGGEVFIFELANNTPSVANVKAYADIVREKSVLRQLIQVAQQVADNAFEPGERSVNELLDGAERDIFAIAEQTGKTGQFKDIKRLLSVAVDKIDKLYHSNESITGLPTGFDKFDDLTSGLQPADLVIVAGRPSMGKTAFAINIAEYAAIKTQQPILIYSMEMPGDALAMRLISSLGRIDQQNLRTGKLSDQDWPRVTSSIHTLADVKLYIDDTPALSPSEVRARARRMAREHGQIGLIVIDYLQLMRVPGIRIENRTAEISEISRSLKALAKELNTPVIALSQLNRSLEQRSDRRPVMSDLRESGAIEQDADLIAFIYRDEVYNEDSPDKGIAEIIIAKQRNGPIGKVRLAFLGRYTKFENLANDAYQQVA
jgi:replicative DNA helicase